MEIIRGSRILSTYCNCKNEEILCLIKGRKKSIFALLHRKYMIKRVRTNKRAREKVLEEWIYGKYIQSYR